MSSARTEKNATNTIDPKRELLRHTVAAPAYPAAKTLRAAPEDFASFRIGETSRTSAQILAHIGEINLCPLLRN